MRGTLPYLPLSLLTFGLLVGLTLAQPKSAPNVVPEGPKEPADERLAFKLPPGFEAQLVAAEPDIHKPLNLAFDDRGRLWLTDTVEYPFPAPADKKPRDTVKILEDFGPDGRARKITTFADGLNIPIGLIPLPNPKPQDALVYSIPNIYRIRDDKGTGHADKREVLYSTYGFRDTHGMTSNFNWGFDGWIYACHGFSNTSTVKGSDGKPTTMQSGNTYRIRPDGSHLEQFTHGQVNPFGLCFDPLGYLYSADCHSQPIYQLIRGGCYPSFGKPDDGLGFAPEMFTGYKGSTAISGIVYYAADHFPSQHGTVYIGDVMTNEIIQFHLKWHGSSPQATVTSFLTSSDRWFRPVDIKLGPDGALYIADFYNRIIGHYEVPLDHPGRDRERGRVWRIVYTGKDHKGTPAPHGADFVKASVKELVDDLAHPNLTVRMKATNQLVERGKEAAPALTEILTGKGPAHQRAHALWALERLDSLKDDALTQAAKQEEEVRVHVARILSERSTRSKVDHQLCIEGLSDGSAHVQRAHAEALGQHPDASNVRPLLDLLHKVPGDDTHLRYTVRVALRNQLNPEGISAALEEIKFSDADQASLADVSLGVPTKSAAHFLLGQLINRKWNERGPYSREMVRRFIHHIARHGTEKDSTDLMEQWWKRRTEVLGDQIAELRAFEKGLSERGAKLDEPTKKWVAELTEKGLRSKTPADVVVGIELAESLKLTDQQPRLLELLTAKGTPTDQRVAAMKALAAMDAVKHAPTLGKVLTSGGYQMGVREQAAKFLSQANQPTTRAELEKALPIVPARLQTTVAASLAATKEGAEILLGSVKSGKASARLLQERAVSVPLGNTKLPGLTKRVEELTAGLPPADARINELIRQRGIGFGKAKRDVARGVKAFEKNCAACHQIDGKGAKIGPQLDGIGLRGLDRLLEDVLDPNRNVDQAFRLTTLALTKGQVVQGLVLREEGAVLVLADSQGKEVRVPSKEVEERTTSQMSLMPANLVDTIPEPEFYDLLEYLLNQRTVRPEKK
jgi:putative heme-binding domain-containing protein